MYKYAMYCILLGEYSSTGPEGREAVCHEIT